MNAGQRQKDEMVGLTSAGVGPCNPAAGGGPGSGLTGIDQCMVMRNDQVPLAVFTDEDCGLFVPRRIT